MRFVMPRRRTHRAATMAINDNHMRVMRLAA